MAGVTDFGEKSSAPASEISAQVKAVLFAKTFQAQYQTAPAKSTSEVGGSQML